MGKYSERDKIVETVNKLFVYTDECKWNVLQTEVFTQNVQFDMSSIGGEKKEMPSKEICDGWQKGFENIDSVNHLAGNYIVDIHENTADVFAYATATHYKKNATKGNTREFVGTYNLHLLKSNDVWKIDSFKYNLKYASGNVDFE